MGIVFSDLVDGLDWLPMSLDQQDDPRYTWEDGRPLSEAPVDFAATFDGAMFVTTKPIDLPSFNRNPLRVRPDFVVPRHEHNIDEMIFVLQGEYRIDHGGPGEEATTTVGPGEYFTSRAGTPYTMNAGPQGVTYFETWAVPVEKLETVWYDVGWIRR